MATRCATETVMGTITDHLHLGSFSTIGFGDIIPEKTLSSNQTESKKRIILIVLYILGGMALVAMNCNISMFQDRVLLPLFGTVFLTNRFCFLSRTLVYEQLAFKFRNIGTRFQLRSERSHSGNGRDIKIVTNKFINCAEDIDV